MPSNIAMNNDPSKHGTARRHRRVASVLLIMVFGGCHMWENPFHDPLAGSEPIMTASSQRAIELPRQQRDARRDFSTVEVHPDPGSVIHGPLYFEDGFEDVPMDDEDFAWTGEDFLHIFSWRARFLLNLALFPISAVDTPPGSARESDGRPSRTVLWKEHDARKIKSTQDDGDEAGDGHESAG